MTEYILSIKANKKLYSNISSLLKIEPTNTEFTWDYSINENDKRFSTAVISILDMLEPNLKKLIKLGINSNDITLWYFYVYENQCNMEFTPVEMKRLGDNNITLCISCWEDENSHR